MDNTLITSCDITFVQSYINLFVSEIAMDGTLRILIHLQKRRGP